jgi:MFS family permease
MSLLWSMDVIQTLAFFSIGVLMPVWKEEFGLTPTEAGLLGAIGFLGFGLMALPSSIWLTKYNPRLITSVCALLMGVAIAAHALAPNTGMFMLIRFAFVVFAVCRIQMQVIFIQQWFVPRLYATANSLDFGARAIGQVIATALVPVAAIAMNGWGNVYILLGIILTGITVAWGVVGKIGPFQQSGISIASDYNPALILKSNRTVWLIAGSQIGAAMAFGSFMIFYPSYAMINLGISLERTGFLMAAFPLGNIVGSLSAAPISEVLGRRKPIIWVSGIALPLLYTGLMQVDSVTIVLVFLFFAGVCAMAVPPILATIAMDLGLRPREVAVTLGLMRTLFPLGAVFGPIVCGVIEDATGSLAWGLSICAPMAVSLFVIGVLLPETFRADRDTIARA